MGRLGKRPRARKLATAAVLSLDLLAYLPVLPLAVTGPWLAAVDFDVVRIPNCVLTPTAVATLLGVVGNAAAARDWRTLIVPIVPALVTGGVFAAVHFASRGGVGFGDVNLAAVICLALSLLGVGAAWLGLLAGSFGALAWARRRAACRDLGHARRG